MSVTSAPVNVPLSKVALTLALANVGAVNAGAEPGAAVPGIETTGAMVITSREGSVSGTVG
jgi:hypothetical protein